MGERRPLAKAMTMTSEKMAFIHGTAVSPNAVTPTADAKPATAVTPASQASSANHHVADVPTVKPREKLTRGQNSGSATASRDSKPQQNAAQEGFYSPILVPLTTRLQPKTADALRRACLEQKLARKIPNSQQEIVELALAKWLEQNGFA